MKKTLLVSLVALGTTAFAASDTFKVTLLQDSVVEGKSLKAGDYKVSVENGNAVFKQGKQSIEVPARQETETSKNPTSISTYRDGTNLQEIRLGGTHTKLVFDGSTSTAPHAGI